jgi:uncharacterized protein (TIGR03086 family)
MDIRALDRRALEATDRVVERVKPADLTAPTPCAGWDLRALLVHMAGNNNGFAEAAEGRPANPDVWAGVGTEDDPVTAYLASADRVRAAFAGDAAPDFEVYGFGTYPTEAAIGMHFIDYLVHGWDVAAALGIDHPLDQELCATVLRMGERWPADSPAIWGPGAPFGYRVPVPDTDSPDRRMLGFLGRSPDLRVG